jgi:hypothetical protein
LIPQQHPPSHSVLVFFAQLRGKSLIRHLLNVLDILTFNIFSFDTEKFTAFLFLSILIESTNARFGNREKVISGNANNDDDVSNGIKESDLQKTKIEYVAQAMKSVFLNEYLRCSQTSPNQR